MVKFFSVAKNGRLINRKNGEYVERIAYDHLVKENRTLKKDLTIDNFLIKYALLIESLGLQSHLELTAQVMGTSLRILLDGILQQNQTKPEHSPTSATQEPSASVSANPDNAKVKE